MGKFWWLVHGLEYIDSEIGHILYETRALNRWSYGNAVVILGVAASIIILMIGVLNMLKAGVTAIVKQVMAPTDPDDHTHVADATHPVDRRDVADMDNEMVTIGLLPNRRQFQYHFDMGHIFPHRTQRILHSADSTCIVWSGSHITGPIIPLVVMVMQHMNVTKSVTYRPVGEVTYKRMSVERKSRAMLCRITFYDGYLSAAQRDAFTRCVVHLTGSREIELMDMDDVIEKYDEYRALVSMIEQNHDSDNTE